MLVPVHLLLPTSPLNQLYLCGHQQIVNYKSIGHSLICSSTQTHTHILIVSFDFDKLKRGVVI